MADVQLKQLLQGLDGAAAPDPAFSDALYERVAPMALAAGRRDRTWFGRIMATLRSRSIVVFPTADPRFRSVVLGTALLLLALALAIVIGSRRPDPNQLVRSSEQLYNDPPALDMSVRYEDGAVRRFRYDGQAITRLDVVSGTYRGRPQGTIFLMDAQDGRRIEWDPASATWSDVPALCCQRPLYELDLRWGAEMPGLSRPRSQSRCLEWEYVAEAEVAGRPAHHVRCTTAGRHEEFWIDGTNGFVLRSTDVPTDDQNVRMTGEVRSLLLDASVDPGVFAMPEGDARIGALIRGGNDPFEPGVRYVSNRFAPGFAVTPGEGWRQWGTDGDVVGFVRGRDADGDEASVFVLRLEVVTDVATGRDVTLEPGVDAAVEWLRTHPYIETGAPEAARVGAEAAVSFAFQIELPDDFGSSCPRGDPNEPPPACMRMFKAGTGYWTFEGEDQVDNRAMFLDVHGTAVVILISADGPDLEAHLAAIDELLASIEFFE